jgi:hypothetical protein
MAITIRRYHAAQPGEVETPSAKPARDHGTTSAPATALWSGVDIEPAEQVHPTNDVAQSRWPL